jgi:hypothetical protein
MKKYEEKKYETKDRYLIQVWGDTDPTLFGPYADDEDRLQDAKEAHQEDEGRSSSSTSTRTGNPTCGPSSETLSKETKSHDRR